MSNQSITIEYSGAGYTAQTHTRWHFFEKIVTISVRIDTKDEVHFTKWIGSASEHMAREQALLQESLRDLGIL